MRVLTREPYSLPAEICQVSGEHVRLLVPRPVQAGTAVRVRWGALMLVGEAMDAHPDCSGFMLSMRLCHVLFETDDLALSWRFLREARV